MNYKVINLIEVFPNLFIIRIIGSRTDRARWILQNIVFLYTTCFR